ncbi:MAG: adenosylcobinamide amidohydrolase [SAR324 cluster bacterium]|nr:adenosylcobinamide amidohydrolase [SAR324 cluster bacterium]
MSDNLNQLLSETDLFRIYRKGRFLMCELLTAHQTLTTSYVNGGFRENQKWLINHQSCEASAHEEVHSRIAELGQARYHTTICDSFGFSEDQVSLMSTAANMHYAAVKQETFRDMTVTACVTAGVQGNASRSGDPAKYDESFKGWNEVPPEGTINTLLLINVPLTPAALTRSVVTMTEAKSAALEELSVGSRYSQGLATGTGTDQFCIASPIAPEQYSKTWTGAHTKIGELIGKAVTLSTREALRWQNGLEMSYTRSVFHILQRYGLTEAVWNQMLARFSTEQELRLFKANQKAFIYDPQISCGAFILAVLLDKQRYGVIPEAVVAEQIVHELALLMCVLGQNHQQFAANLQTLKQNSLPPLELFVYAIVEGTRLKWSETEQ